MTRTTLNDTDIILSARVLGALFYTAPEQEPAAALATALRNGSWCTQWPQSIPCRAEIDMLFRTRCDEPLQEAWQRLFIGPDALPAAPWGSVWLDREKVLFGESTLILRQWMRDSHIAFQAEQNEPEDHIGLLLLLSAWLLEHQQPAHWQTLLAQHLLPWSGHFLQRFTARAAHPFYTGLGYLAQDTLTAWQTRLTIPIAEKKIWP